MKVIIPAAGMGKRLRPHTYLAPKAMVQVAGYPIIGHIIRSLRGIAPEEIIIIAGYKKEAMIAWVSSEFPDMNITFVEQKEMLGLGHAVYTAGETVNEDDELFIILGDTIVDMDISAMVSQKTSSLGVREVEDPRRFGVAETEDGVITDLVEKPEHPKSNLALMGVYYIKESGELFRSIRYLIDNDIRTRNEYQITDALNHMIKKGVVMTPFSVDHWFDCGTIPALLETNRFLLDKNSPAAENEGKGNVFIPPVLIHDTAEVEHCVIGPYVSVGAHAKIKRSVIRAAVIAERAVISNTVIEKGIIGEGAVVKETHPMINLGADGSIDAT